MTHALSFLREPVPVMLDPVLRLGSPTVAGQGTWSLPLQQDSRVLLTFGATAALYQTARALALGPADRVLFPSYNCGHEIEPFLRTGARPGFYRVDRTASVDLESLESGLDRHTRAVLVTHYFGFPQALAEIRDLCDARGIALIEDCAHALFGSDEEIPFGMAGHFAVFSLRKSLPLPHGGAVVCHDPRWSLPETLAAPPLLSTATKLLERYQKGWMLPRGRSPGFGEKLAFLATRFLVDGMRTLRWLHAHSGSVQLDPDDEDLDFPQTALDWGVAKSTRRALERLSRTEADTIVAARRKNYSTLLSHADRFVGCSPFRPKLPPGTCPLYFPVRAVDAGELVHRLQHSGISAVEWWALYHPDVPWSEFAEADELKQHLAVLPVHQDLGEVHMHRIADVLSEAD